MMLKRLMLSFLLLVLITTAAGCKTEPSSIPTYQGTSPAAGQISSSDQAAEESLQMETPNAELDLRAEDFSIYEAGLSLTLHEPFYQIATSDLTDEQQIMQILAYIDGMEQLDEPHEPGSMSGVDITVRYRGDTYSYYFDSRGLGRKDSDTDVHVWYSVDADAYSYLKDIVINLVFDHLPS